MKQVEEVTEGLSAADPLLPNNEQVMKRTISIFIAMTVRLYRDGLAELLSRQTGFALKGIAADKTALLAQVQSLQPDIILIDTAIPDSRMTVRMLVDIVPKSRVIALAVTEAETDIISFAEAGVSGYVTRDGSYEDLVATIRSVSNGELVCTPRIAAMLLRRVTKGGSDLCPESIRLTPRERQIVEFIDQGLSNKEIACRLNIELSTVKNHVHHILEKSSTNRRGAAAAHFCREFLHRASIRANGDPDLSIHADRSKNNGHHA